MDPVLKYGISIISLNFQKFRKNTDLNWDVLKEVPQGLSMYKSLNLSCHCLFGDKFFFGLTLSYMGDLKFKKQSFYLFLCKLLQFSSLSTWSLITKEDKP
jgi:hypothetical protein